MPNDIDTSKIPTASDIWRSLNVRIVERYIKSYIKMLRGDTSIPEEHAKYFRSMADNAERNLPIFVGIDPGVDQNSTFVSTLHMNENGTLTQEGINRLVEAGLQK